MINQTIVSLTDEEKTKILEAFTDWKWGAEADNKMLKKKLEQSEALNQAFIRTYLSGQHDNLPELFRKVYNHDATPTDMVNLKKLGFCLEDVVMFVRKVEKLKLS